MDSECNRASSGLRLNNFWVPFLCLVSVPFGTAVQNLVIVVVAAALLYNFSWRRFSLQIAELPQMRIALIAGALALFLPAIATLLNPSMELKNIVKELGYLPWLFFPALILGSPIQISSDNRQRLWQLLTWILALWAIIALSQNFFGWRVLGVEFVSDLGRPRGFYSHPLTLAYAMIFLWPLAIERFCSSKYSPSGLILCISVGVVMWLTQSRTIQALAFAVLLWNLFTRTSKRQRLKGLGLACICGALVFLLPNPVGQKFKATFSSAGVDKFSGYPDDRLAFWHAHALMVVDKPFLGHGVALGTEYRLPYYQKIGLHEFVKPYEAHNTFLQMTAEGGLLALLAFLLWVWHFFRFTRSLPSSAMRVAGQSFSFFALAAMTQNAFQDFEVRWILTIFCSALVLFWVETAREASGKAPLG